MTNSLVAAIGRMPYIDAYDIGRGVRACTETA
jgi:hypothetical protein